MQIRFDAFDAVLPGGILSFTVQFVADASHANVALTAQVNKSDTGETISSKTLPVGAILANAPVVRTFEIRLPSTIRSGLYNVSFVLNTADAKWTELGAKKGAFVFVVGNVAVPAPPPTPEPTPVPPPASTAPIFREEYNGDLRQWEPGEPWQTSPGYYMSENVYAPIPPGVLAEIKNGMLAHRLRLALSNQPYKITGSELNTRKSFNNFVHGTIEARFKIPAAAQAWSAFWLLGNGTGAEGWPKCGEIDIFEVVNNGKEDGIPYVTVHWSGQPSGGNQGHYMKGVYTKKLPNPFSVPHTWRFLRSPNEIVVWIDGVQWAKMTRAELAAIGGDYGVVFDGPMHLRTTLSSGGDEGRVEGSVEDWAYDPNRPPQAGEMLIEYIRVSPL